MKPDDELELVDVRAGVRTMMAARTLSQMQFVWWEEQWAPEPGNPGRMVWRRYEGQMAIVARVAQQKIARGCR